MVSTWCICLTEILKEKHRKLSDYLNQVLATLSALQRFGFFWTPAAKAAHKSWLGASGPDCHLMPKIGHLQKTEIAFKF